VHPGHCTMTVMIPQHGQLLPMILLIILFSFNASPLRLDLMAQLFLGLLLIYHLAALSFLSTLFRLLSLPKVFHKDQLVGQFNTWYLLQLIPTATRVVQLALYGNDSFRPQHELFNLHCMAMTASDRAFS